MDKKEPAVAVDAFICEALSDPWKNYALLEFAVDLAKSRMAMSASRAEEWESCVSRALGCNG